MQVTWQTSMQVFAMQTSANGKKLAEIIPKYRYIEQHSLVEGMVEFIPVYKVIGKIPFVSNISNKIVVMEK